MNKDFLRCYMDDSIFKTKKLSPFMKYYRILGFCYYDNNGQPRLIYKVYCFGIFVLFWILYWGFFSVYTSEEYFTLKSATQRLPLILKQTLRFIHIFIASVWVLKNNPFIKDFYTCISCIQDGIKSNERRSHSDLLSCRALSILHFCLITVTSCSFIIKIGNTALEKNCIFILLMLTFIIYVKEEWVILTMLTTKNTLIQLNQYFRKCPITAKNIQKFRKIHTQLVALNLQLNDHFCLMITTWIISSALIIWASGFQIIRLLMSGDNSSKYLLVSYALDALHHLTKMVTVCHYCEAVKEEVISSCYIDSCGELFKYLYFFSKTTLKQEYINWKTTN